MLALAAEYRRLKDSFAPAEALALAAQWTLIPGCVPRNNAGSLAEAAKERLLLEVVKAGRAL